MLVWLTPAAICRVGAGSSAMSVGACLSSASPRDVPVPSWPLRPDPPTKRAPSSPTTVGNWPTATPVLPPATAAIRCADGHELSGGDHVLASVQDLLPTLRGKLWSTHRKRPATQRMQPGEGGNVVEASEAAPSRIDEWRRFFRERGIAPHDVPLALAVHEVHAPPRALPFRTRTLSGVPSAGGPGWGDDPVRY